MCTHPLGNAIKMIKINKKIAQDILNELTKYLWLGTKFCVTKNDALRYKILQYKIIINILYIYNKIVV